MICGSPHIHMCSGGGGSRQVKEVKDICCSCRKTWDGKCIHFYECRNVWENLGVSSLVPGLKREGALSGREF